MSFQSPINKELSGPLNNDRILKNKSLCRALQCCEILPALVGGITGTIIKSLHFLKTNMEADFPSLEIIHSSCIHESQRLRFSWKVPMRKS